MDILSTLKKEFWVAAKLYPEIEMQLKMIWKILLSGCCWVMSGQYGHIDDFYKADVTINRTEKNKTTAKQQKWYELHGSLNRQPVYLIVEKIGQEQVVGYLFDGKGNKKYIYGEWFKNELQVYDQSNKRLTILLAK